MQDIVGANVLINESQYLINNWVIITYYVI